MDETRVMVVDDEEIVCERLREHMERNDLRVATGRLSGRNSGVNRLYLLTYPVEADGDEEGDGIQRVIANARPLPTLPQCS